MKRIYFYLLFSLSLFTSSVSIAQNNETIFKQRIDSIISQKLHNQKSQRDATRLVFLKDSTFSIYMSDAIGNCEDYSFSFSKTKFSYDFQGRLINVFSKYLDVYECQWYQYKYIFSYNNHSNLINQFLQEFNFSNLTWENKENKMFIYDENEKLIENIIENWDTTSASWVNGTKNEYSYHTNGKILNEKYYLWDTTFLNWFLYSKENYTYNSNWTLTQYLREKWDSESNEWYIIREKTYSFDSNSNLLKETYYSNSGTPNNNESKYYREHLYSYDTHNNKLEFIFNKYDFLNNQLKPIRKENNVYNILNLQNEKIVFNWDTTQSEWINYFKYTITYDLQNRKSHVLQHQWNNNWQLKYKTLYSYNTNNDLLEAFTWEWKNSQQWENYRRELVDYNPEYRISNHLYQTWFSEFWWNDYEEHFEFDRVGNLIYSYEGHWMSAVKTYHYYSQYDILQNAEFDDSTLKIYPIPSNNFIQIKGLKDRVQINIYSSNSKIVCSKEIFNENLIDISKLQTGVYFIRFVGYRQTDNLVFIKE